MPPADRPDSARGIFETLLVVRGAPVAAAAHLERLEASVSVVYGRSLPADADRLVAEHADGLQLGRLRLTAVPAPDFSALDLEVEAGELGDRPHFPERALTLRPHQVGGGLGCHKWADRASLPAASADEAPLLVDGEEVLEAAWANVFAVRDGAVFTPPLDGRILPGVTRATVIELTRGQDLEVAECPLTLEGLRQADEVFLTNSIRGMEIVGSVDEVALPVAPGPVAAVLREDLRTHWQSEAAAPKGGRSLTA